MVPADKRRSWLARQVGTLVLSHVRVQNPMAVVRAAAWANRMGRLGVHLPLFIVQDVGLLLTVPKGTAGLAIVGNETLLAGSGVGDDVRALLRQYAGLLTTIASSEI